MTIKVAVTINGSDGSGRELKISAAVELATVLPTQDERLPDHLEILTVNCGREFMKELYRQLLERADLELVIANRGGKAGAGILRIGKRPYTFKTSFGNVTIKRIRIKHKWDGSTEVLSGRIWRTPKQYCITGGLKRAVCELAVKQSYASSKRVYVCA